MDRSKPATRTATRIAITDSIEPGSTRSEMRAAPRPAFMEQFRASVAKLAAWAEAMCIEPEPATDTGLLRAPRRSAQASGRPSGRRVRSTRGSPDDDPGEPAGDLYRVKLRSEARSVHSYIAQTFRVDGAFITATARRRSAWSSGTEWGPLKTYCWPAREVLVAEEVVR